eukprot:6182009-Pleurochrysis_carterae.AAC.1
MAGRDRSASPSRGARALLSRTRGSRSAQVTPHPALRQTCEEVMPWQIKVGALKAMEELK